MAVNLLERARAGIKKHIKPETPEEVVLAERPDLPNSQFESLARERSRLWVSITGGEYLPQADKAAYGAVQFRATEEEAELPPQNENERLYANLMRRYKPWQLNEGDHFLVSFSEEEAGEHAISLLQIHTFPHAQAEVAGDDYLVPVLRIAEVADGTNYGISILAEKDANFSGATPDGISGFDESSDAVLWSPPEESPLDPNNIAWKQQFYADVLTHINRAVTTQGGATEFNKAQHTKNELFGLVQGADPFSISSTLVASE